MNIALMLDKLKNSGLSAAFQDDISQLS